MAKKELRIVQAPEGVAKMVTKGVEVDNELKNLTFEDKACKQGIADFVKKNIEDGELGLIVECPKAIAMVSKAQSFKVEADAETFPEMVRTVKLGMLSDVVKMKRTLIVPPDSIDVAAKALEDAGITSSIVDEFSVKPADLRKHDDLKTASEDVQRATDALKGCLSESETYRVKFKVRGK